MHERRARKIRGLVDGAAAVGARDRAGAVGQRRGHAGVPDAVSEVLGHVDLLLERGEVRELELGGVVRFEATVAARRRARPRHAAGGGRRAVGGRRARSGPVSDRARPRRAVMGFLPVLPGRRARPGPRARHLPAAAAVLGGVLRQPARPEGRPADISLLAIGLVVATAVAVAVVAHALIDGPAVGGGVRARGDRGADRPGGGDRRSPGGSTSRAGRSTILEGESLINDGTALVLYRVAVGAVGGTFSLARRRRGVRARRGRAASRSASPSAG